MAAGAPVAGIDIQGHPVKRASDNRTRVKHLSQHVKQPCYVRSQRQASRCCNGSKRDRASNGASVPKLDALHTLSRGLSEKVLLSISVFSNINTQKHVKHKKGGAETFGRLDKRPHADRKPVINTETSRQAGGFLTV